jgi:hypothetical protein
MLSDDRFAMGCAWPLVSSVHLHAQALIFFITAWRLAGHWALTAGQTMADAVWSMLHE